MAVVLRFWFGLGLLLVGLAPAAAAELLVLERAGCPWCARFEAEIAPIWEKTDEGARLPLRRVDIDAAPPAYAFVLPERITPTFVLVDGGREVGRMRGYAGQDFFWGRLGVMLEALPK